MNYNRLVLTATPLAMSILISCQTTEITSKMEAAKKKTTYEVGYTDIQLQEKNFRYIDLVSEGQSEYYVNLQKVIKKSKEEGYVLYYEGLKLEDASTEVLVKLYKLNLYAAKDASPSIQAKLLKNQGYAFKKDYEFKGIVNNSDYAVDMSAKDWVTAYEAKNGKIVLMPKDSSSDMKRPKQLPLAKQVKVKDININTRAKVIANEIYKSGEQKIILLYNFEMKRAILSNLDSLSKAELITKNLSTKNDSNYVHSITASESRRLYDNHLKEDGYIDDMSGYVNAKLAVVNKLELFNLTANNNRYEIYANSPTALRFSVDYKTISIGYSFTPDFFKSNKDEELYGKSRGFGGHLGLVYPHWFHEFGGRYIQGFYLNNTQDYDSTWTEGDPYISKPDLFYASIEGVTGYKFNPRFSVRSLTSQTERQLKSAGSFIATTNYKWFQTKDESSPKFGDSLLSSNNLEIGINFGYYYTLVIKQAFYISAGLAPGFGYIQSDVEKNPTGISETNSYSSTLFRLAGKLAAGYNAERLVIGAYADFTGGSFYNEDAPILNSNFNNTYMVFVAYRLEASEQMRNIKK